MCIFLKLEGWTWHKGKIVPLWTEGHKFDSRKPSLLSYIHQSFPRPGTGTPFISFSNLTVA